MCLPLTCIQPGVLELKRMMSQNKCTTCGGHGQVKMQQGFFNVQQECPHCRGSGVIGDLNQNQEPSANPDVTGAVGTAYIYILSNPSMPGIYKIGFTTKTVKDRVCQLNASTSIPTPFSIEESYEIEAGIELAVETRAHQLLKTIGKHKGKEFFEAELELCKGVVHQAIADVRQ